MRTVLVTLFCFCMIQLVEAQSKRLDPSQFHHARSGLSNAFAAFKKGKGRVAFMGGSITEAHGWRDSVCAFLQQKFPETTFEFINAGISSTGSTPGAFRLSNDVLSHGKIDLLFEEAAVNDPTNGFFGKYQIRGMEGIVRQAFRHNPQMDMIILYCAEPASIQNYHDHITPDVITQHERVAVHYHVNSIDLAKEVAERISHAEFSWEKDFKDLHPSPFGHDVYARSIIAFIEQEWEKQTTAKPHKLPSLLDPFSYVHGSYLDIRTAKILNGFILDEHWKPKDFAPVRNRYVDVPVLKGEAINDALTLSFKGKAIGLCVTSGPDAGMLEYSIDGQSYQKVDLFTKWSKSLHLPWYIVLNDELVDKEHIIQLRVSADKNPQSVGHAIRIHQFLVN